MKRTLLVLAVFLVSLCAASVASAQDEATAGNTAVASSVNDLGSLQRVRQSLEPFEKGMFFPNKEACRAAFENGDYRIYLPDPKNWRKTISSTAKGFPTPGCAFEDVREESPVGSPAWIIWAANTPAEVGEEGLPVVDGRCDNIVHEFVPLELPSGPPGAQGLQGVPGRDGASGRDGTDGRDGQDVPWQARLATLPHRSICGPKCKTGLVVAAAIVTGLTIKHFVAGSGYVPVTGRTTYPY
jgi:hypothetical protein